jgi:hypothetical protein
MKAHVIVPRNLGLRIVILSNSLTNKILFQAYIFDLSQNKHGNKLKNQLSSIKEPVYCQKPDGANIKKEKCQLHQWMHHILALAYVISSFKKSRL